MSWWGTPREYFWGALSLFIAILLAVALMLFAHPAPAPAPGPSVYDGEIDDLDRDAIRRSYQEHISNLFMVWMRDPTGEFKGSPSVLKARQAYINAMTAIDARR